MAYTITPAEVLTQLNYFVLNDMQFAPAYGFVSVNCQLGYRHPTTGAITLGSMQNVTLQDENYTNLFERAMDEGSFGQVLTEICYEILFDNGIIPMDATELP